jgi:hypothetical protein
MLTTAQIKNRTKFVTRRLGWKKLKPGELFQGVEKAQGLKKGEHPVPLGIMRCDSNTEEQLRRMTDDREYGLREVKLEGFPTKTPDAFVEMFCEHTGIQQTAGIQRIQFSYVIDIGEYDFMEHHVLSTGREVEWEGNDGSRYNAIILRLRMGGHYELQDKQGVGTGVISCDRIKKIFISA